MIDVGKLKQQKNLTALIVLGFALLGIPFAMATLQKPTHTESRASNTADLTGDVTKDGLINLDDVATIRQAIDKKQYSKEADINNDGAVNNQDIATFYEHLSAKR